MCTIDLLVITKDSKKEKTVHPNAVDELNVVSCVHRVF